MSAVIFAAAFISVTFGAMCMLGGVGFGAAAVGAEVSVTFAFVSVFAIVCELKRTTCYTIAKYFRTSVFAFVGV